MLWILFNISVNQVIQNMQQFAAQNCGISSDPSFYNLIIQQSFHPLSCIIHFTLISGIMKASISSKLEIYQDKL